MYKTKTGQTVLDALLQNKGAILGQSLVDIKDDISAVTQVFTQGIELDIEKRQTLPVKEYDRRNITVTSDEI